MAANCSIRHATLADVPAITAIYNDAVLKTVATFDTEPKSQAERAAWLQAHDAAHPVLVALVDGQVAGWASLQRWSDRPAYDCTAETSFYVAEAWQGQGIGRALLVALLDEARGAGLHTLLARTSAGSDASIHLHESLGFERVGTLRQVGRKFGRLLDVHVLQLILDERGEQ